MKKVILISGGSDGLGKAIATKMSKKHTVVIIATNEKKLKMVADEIKCDYHVCDVSDYDSLDKTVSKILDKHKRIDCLINNAGLMVEGKLTENDAERIKKVVDVNTLGTIYFSKAVLPQMIKQNEGLIINVISQGGIKARINRSVYNASKWAITGFTKSLQLEVAEHNIRITGFYPGKFKSNMFEKINVKHDMSDALEVEDVVKAVEYVIETDKNILIPEFGVIDIRRK